MKTFAWRWVLCAVIEASVASPGVAQTTAQPAASVPGALSRADAVFLKQAAQAGHAEIEAGKLAVSKGVNTQVKGFAQQMVDDHTKAADELAMLAKAKGVALPDEPSLVQRTKIKLLAASDGGSFDRRYTDVMAVNAHQDAVKLFRKAANGARDGDVKAYAAKTLPALEHHLQTARELKGVVDKEGNVKALADRKQ